MKKRNANPVHDKWCAMCGQWTDHQSGTCPELAWLRNTDMNEDNITKQDNVGKIIDLPSQSGDHSPKQPKETPEQPKEAVLEGAVDLIKINIDELKDNSVLVIKIAPEGMHQRQAATQQIAMALRPLAPKIKEKNMCLLVMATGETMEVLDEAQMNQIGWEKKDKSRIITL